ncbi:ABC transporter permease [Gracilibacillus alcaliphilus]|uniref:ABC transporter permease n=1 Tax=Gracilibacillus alcaliphilus TaxID=1401441 RepID=UPI00195B2939|nr:ABC transporter permease [Gracilibacillus alcaliphilus]MBM7675751.1 ABC-2 type transport system permease protein [Gracilibacillus alcaliphilus]
MTIFLFTIRRCFRNIMNIILLCVLPFIVILMPNEEWTLLPLGFQLYGVVLFFAAARITSIIMEDRTKGVLMRIGVAPVTHLQYLWQNLLAYSLILIVQIVVVIAGGILYGHDLINPFLLLVVYVLFALTAIGFSLAWFSLFRHKETAFVVLMSSIMLMTMAGGMIWSVELMPELLQRLAMLFPTYWLAESLIIVATQADPTELAVPFVVLLLFTAAFLVIGSKRRLS